MSDIRQASLEPGSGERVPGFLAQAGPFAILAFGALWLHRRFDQLPARLPIHWNWRGEPDGFVNRSAAGAALPLLLGLGICALMLAMQIGLRRSTPRGAMRAPVIKLVLAGEYLAALLCCGTLATTVSAGRLLWPSLEESVRQSIEVLLRKFSSGFQSLLIQCNRLGLALELLG